MKTNFLIFLVVLFVSLPCLAGNPGELPYKIEDRAEKKKTWIKTVKFDKAAKFELTVGCQPLNSRDAHKMLLTVRIMKITRSGGEAEVRKYRVSLTERTKPKTGKVELPWGEYRIITDAEYCEFVVDAKH